MHADLLDRNDVARVLHGADAAVHAATAIPAPGAHQDWSLNDALRTRGTANLLDAARDEGVGRLLFQSLAMLCHGDDGELLDERAPLKPSRVTASAAEMEAMVAGSSGIGWAILRGGLLYGPGTGRTSGWNAAAREGRLALPRTPSRFVSPIHLADFGSAFAGVLHAAPQGGIFNVVDDCPVTWADLFAHVAALHGQAVLGRGDDEILPSFRASNARLRSATRWVPGYGSYLSGWPAAQAQP
jgi:nucleoside-diphosphate-sugar epimerase